ncbi:MAG: DUF4215 domain-containing protein, partial [Halioglobus sp.]
SCRNDCTIPVCGDMIVDAGEDCDDGNTIDTDSCRNDCTIPVCGDMIVDAGEDCDDGNTIDGDGCNADCTIPGAGCDTHTRGYWTQHAYEAEFVLVEQDGLSVCGQDISTECDPVKGSRFRGQSGNLEAQCLAAALNFAVTEQNGGECSGQLEAFDADGRDAVEIYGDCCGAQSACTDGSKAEVSACIGVLSAFNESMDTAPLDELDLCDYSGHHEDEAHGHCSAEGEVCLD